METLSESQKVCRPRTVAELRHTLCNHDDVAVGMNVGSAIASLVDSGEITDESELSHETLERIRQVIYNEQNNSDPTTMFFMAFVGKTGNPVEASLQYIEKLRDTKIRKIKGCSK